MSDGRPRYQFDHHSAEFARDPWATYRELRSRCPVAYSDTYDGGFWVLSKYEDVRAASLAPAVFSSSERDLLIPEVSAGWLLPVQSDPPATNGYRRALNHLFTVRAVRELEPRIREWTTQAIDAFAERGACDFVKDLAYPVPGKLTTLLVGWSEDGWPSLVLPVKAYTSRPDGDPTRDEAAAELGALRRRIVDNIELRRVEPGKDLVSHLLATDLDGRGLTDDEIVALVMMVIFGGVDTTVAAIGNMLVYLDRDRDLRARLIKDRGLIPAAVDELLRYEAPVQGFCRFPLTPAVVRDQRIDVGEKVLLLWSSANRDEDVFSQPDEVQLDRSPNPHLTFGIGPHRCLGATMARTELRIVLEEVLARIPDYTIDGAGIERTDTAGTVYDRRRIPAQFSAGA